MMLQKVPISCKWLKEGMPVLALKANKAMDNRNSLEATEYFDDTVLIRFGGIDNWIHKDSPKYILPKATSYLKDNSIQMIDWTSVISKDKSEGCVNLWFLNYTKDSDGGNDSSMMIQDVRIKNRKIIIIAEYKKL